MFHPSVKPKELIALRILEMGRVIRDLPGRQAACAQCQPEPFGCLADALREQFRDRDAAWEPFSFAGSGR